MKFSDIAGEVRISSNDAKLFVQTWFKGDDKICISGLRSERTGGLDAVSQSMSAREFVATTDDEVLEQIVFDEDGSRWNIYITLSPIKEDVQLNRRGTKANVDYVPGVWADLDVKPGGFQSRKEILNWLDSLALEPTIICSSGSNGVHAYWRLKWDEKGDENLVDSWWSYLNEMAGERSVDKLIDITRILRLPGTVRFPKKEEKTGKIGAVEVLRAFTDGNHRYTAETIREVSREAMSRRAEERKRTIQKIADRRSNVDELARTLMDSSNHWAYLQAASHVEDYVNETWDWADILEPYGWKFRRVLQDGSKEWARPGQGDRSAVVDYEGSPIMSLLSMSEETGLADLKDANIPLSKYIVALRLMFDDDEDQMVKYIVHEQQQNRKEHNEEIV